MKTYPISGTILKGWQIQYLIRFVPVLWLKYSAKAGMSDKLIMVYLLIYYSPVDNGIIAV